jgi:hypothetical protein
VRYALLAVDHVARLAAVAGAQLAEERLNLHVGLLAVADDEQTAKPTAAKCAWNGLAFVVRVCPSNAAATDACGSLATCD